MFQKPTLSTNFPLSAHRMKSGIPAVCKVNSTLEAVSFFFQINAVRKNITEALKTYVNFLTGTVGPHPVKWRRQSSDFMLWFI